MPEITISRSKAFAFKSTATPIEEEVQVPRVYPDKEGNPNDLNGTQMFDGRGG